MILLPFKRTSSLHEITINISVNDHCSPLESSFLLDVIATVPQS